MEQNSARQPQATGPWQPGRPFDFKAAAFIREALAFSRSHCSLPDDDILPLRDFGACIGAMERYEQHLEREMRKDGVSEDDAADIGNDLLLIKAILKGLKRHSAVDAADEPVRKRAFGAH